MAGKSRRAASRQGQLKRKKHTKGPSGIPSAPRRVAVPDTDEWGGETGIRNGLNTLDGISTLIPMSATFSGTVDSTTVIAGDTIRIFEVTKSSPYLAISGIVRELTTA